ncbi:MAG: S1C family serine protease [Pseudomonadota bacterium]
MPCRSRGFTHACVHVCLVLLLGLTLPLARAQAQSAAQASATEEANRQRFEALQNATVGVAVQVIEDAASARTLGREREGTGVVIAPQGLVLTIGYLVLEAESVQLTTRDQKKIPAQVVAYDAVSGLGLLRPLFSLGDVQPVKLGAAAALDKGAPLIYITGTAPRQVGAVRLIDNRPFTGFWEYHLEMGLYTAPMVLNHSGAGLFNLDGDLVGVGNLLMRDVMPEQDPTALPGNLFVPVDVLAPVFDELLRTGQNPQAGRPWMGVNATELRGQVRITRVTEGSPAADAGLRAGHWVTAVDGAPVRSLEDFYKKVWAHAAADGDIRVSVREAGATRVLDVPVRDRSNAIAKPKGI